ncbi:peptidoglycan-binding domain-containing protein [Alkalibacter mobilis]|uniref:peptidoglycan-binding domain-containing protein n=1 Tax=Alkalibacter mobilis TaxID=2787712 RepID=UPI00189D0D8A|nr:peptidoglycan-binding protein [Alkalibacter mobilis]MBF7095540.1 peptidoglycan-binding protein [Alkalibacter mobilis]
MRVVRKIFLYCLIFLFLLSLSSSFEGKNIIDNKLNGLSLSSDQMKLAFYDKYALSDQGTEVEDENEDSDSKESQDDGELQEEIIYSEGSSGEEIHRYQKILYYLDYSDFVPDGNFQTGTKEAVLAYQADKGFDETGALDKETMDSLDAEKIIYATGKKGDEILGFQKILYYMDYLSQYPDGIFGNLTKEAVKEYQEDRDIEISGELDQITQDSLLGESLTYKTGKRGDEILELQKKLDLLGYEIGEPNGIFGTVTYQAVISFQTDNALDTNGRLDPETIEMIEEKQND